MASALEQTGKEKTATIEDPLFEPYYLIVDDQQFALHKRIPSGHQTQAKSYHVSLGGAISNIISLQTLAQSKGKSSTLKEFVERYEAVSKDIRVQFDHIKMQ